MARSDIENIGRRPHIRRKTDLRLPIGTTPEDTERAVEIVRAILDNHEGMVPDFPPRVFLNDFNDDSLNVCMIYWYHPPGILGLPRPQPEGQSAHPAGIRSGRSRIRTAELHRAPRRRREPSGFLPPRPARSPNRRARDRRAITHSGCDCLWVLPFRNQPSPCRDRGREVLASGRECAIFFRNLPPAIR